MANISFHLRYGESSSIFLFMNIMCMLIMEFNKSILSMCVCVCIKMGMFGLQQWPPPLKCGLWSF